MRYSGCSFLPSSFSSRRLMLLVGTWIMLIGRAPQALRAGDDQGTVPRVQVVAAPMNSYVPEVLRDASGTVHMVYAKDQNAEYVQSHDEGSSWSTPVRVNSEGTVEFKMGERGPKLAQGGDGALHVVWTDCWSPGMQTYVRYAGSRDGGKSFGTRQTLSSTTGNDGVTVAADRAGHVMAFWHVMEPPQEEVPQATWLRMAPPMTEERRGGTTSRSGSATSRPWRAPCACCVPGAEMMDTFTSRSDPPNATCGTSTCSPRRSPRTRSLPCASTRTTGRSRPVPCAGQS